MCLFLNVNCPEIVKKLEIIYNNCVWEQRLSMGGSPGDVSEEPVTWGKQNKGWRMNCDVGEATEGLGNEL